MARILVVDDDISIRALLRSFLEEDGHRVDEAVDGKQGVSQCLADPVDIVITDIIMPEKDGVEFIIELRKSFPCVKIIAMSGGGWGMDAPLGLRLAKAFGAGHSLEKPLSQKRVLEAVHLVLN